MANNNFSYEEIKCSGYQIVLKIHTDSTSYIKKEALSIPQMEILTNEYKILNYLANTDMMNNIPKLIGLNGINSFCEEFITGTPLLYYLSQKETALQYCDKLIDAIKKLHSVDPTPLLALRPECVSWKNYLINTLSQYAKSIERSSLDASIFRKVFEFVYRAIGELPDTHDTVIIHNDLNASNVIVSDDGNVFLIDFERWLIGDPLKEISKMIWWFRKLPELGDHIVFGLFERNLNEYEYTLLKAYFYMDILFHFSLYDTLINESSWKIYFEEEFSIINNIEELKLW